MIKRFISARYKTNEKADFLFQELKDRVKLSRIRDHFICKFISIFYNQLTRNVPALPLSLPASDLTRDGGLGRLVTLSLELVHLLCGMQQGQLTCSSVVMITPQRVRVSRPVIAKVGV